MEKVVHRFTSFEEADLADHTRYRSLSGDEKLRQLLELLMPEKPNEAIIQRSARVYPLAARPTS